MFLIPISFTVVCRLKNLQELDLSYSKSVNVETLEEILTHLPRLWKLDISHCELMTTIKPLTLVANQLEHLSLAGVMILSTSVTIEVLRTLTKLR